MLYDTHAHLDDAKLYPEIENVLARAAAAGVAYINTIGCDWKTSLMSVHIAEKYPEHVFAAVGVHPHEAAGLNAEQEEKLFSLAKAEKVVGWGEIGLDYHYDLSSRDIQRRVFRAQIDAAKQAGLPVIIHDREAHGDVMELLRKYRPRGVMHCFSGSAEMAAEFLKFDCFFSFGGAITFKNARKEEVIRAIPREKLLTETDAPYLTPEPFRGKLNSPKYIKYVYEKIAAVLGVSFAETESLVRKNAAALFGRIKI